MATFYTIDRKRTLTPGMTINLAPPDYSPLVKQNIPFDPMFLHAQFAAGLSMHGQRYLLNWSSSVQGHKVINGEQFPLIYSTPAIETIFELVRIHEFNHRLSRFQAMFGCDSLQKLGAFCAWRNSHGPVYEVESEPSENLDLAFLETGNTMCHAWGNARKYWGGARSANPILECLVRLPATLGDQVAVF
jgi:hypothetical protein